MRNLGNRRKPIYRRLQGMDDRKRQIADGPSGRDVGTRSTRRSPKSRPAFLRQFPSRSTMVRQPQWQEALIVGFSVAWPIATFQTLSGKVRQSQEAQYFT